MPRQHPFDQLIRPQEIRPVAQVLQKRNGTGKGFGLPGQGVPQELPPLARLGKGVKFPLAQPEKRRAQDGRQRQIVLGQREETQKRAQVAHGKLRAKLQPVGARNLKPRILAGADDLVKHLRPPLDEDQKVPLMHRARPVLRLDHRTCVDHPPNLARDPARQKDDVVVLAQQVLRIGPVLGLGRHRLRHQRPKIDPPGHLPVIGDMAHRPADAALHPFVEGQIDNAQDRIRRTEGMFQFERLKRQVRGPEPFRELPPHVIDDVKVGALEGIDGLLPVADDKDRPLDLAHAKTGGEFLRKTLDHPPLRRAGVLCLIDKDVVDAAIQPVKHPGGDIPVREQFRASPDQIVEIEPAARRLARLIKRQEDPGKGMQRSAATGGGKRDTPRARGLHP